ncbi:MAG TPA: hypothetical protein VHW69_14480 [Rhizomicrobium sp.]|jgi:magnesium-transporting ATPase (P-type)|nr:hypothetical protein [Rhizomicrobium sp.]
MEPGSAEHSFEPKRKGRWGTLSELACMAALCVWLSGSRGFALHTWFDIALVVGAVGFSIASLILLGAAIFAWPDEKTERVGNFTFLWLVLVPIGIGIAIWLGIPLWQWFQSIPSWAAVIIVLLVLIFINMPKGD